MTEDYHYHLTPDPEDLHSLQVRRVADQVYMCSNGRCFGFSRHMAEQLQLALSAVLFNNFEVASTETFDRLELEVRRTTLIERATRAQPTIPEPDVEDL